MAVKVDKVLITNANALGAKYGPYGIGQINDAITALIAADSARGLVTQRVDLDDAASMTALNAAPVADPKDEAANKAAVDGIVQALSPHYIVLLGSADIVPYQSLVNPLYGTDADPDQFVPSDLPYACDAPYGTSIAAFVAADRVVGRIPDIPDWSDPGFISSILATAAGYQPLPAAQFNSVFGMCAQYFQRSAQQTLAAISNGQTLHVVPPETYYWSADLLSCPIHFFDCHGDQDAPNFLGQSDDGSSSPVALDVYMIRMNSVDGVVVATEACYGAQIYSINGDNIPASMCSTYFYSGCYGYFGSTTTAFGGWDGAPPDIPVDFGADTLCQLFLRNVVSGDSLGHAVAAARQSFIAGSAASNATSLKTLAQFILLGDPALKPVSGAVGPAAAAAPQQATAPVTAAAAHSLRIARGRRRRTLKTRGARIAAQKPVAHKPIKTSGKVAALLQDRAHKAGREPSAIFSFAVVRPRGAKLPAGPRPTRVHLMFVRRSGRTRGGKRRNKQLRLMVAYEARGRLLYVQTLVSR